MTLWTPGRWHQAPAYFTFPPFEHTAGYRGADFLAELTFRGEPLVADEDQRNLLAVLFAGPRGADYRRRDLRWAAPLATIIAARQNIKTSTAWMGVLIALFLLNARRVVWSAHVFNPTTKEAFDDFREIIEDNRALSKRVKTVHTASGREAIEFANRAKLRFVARSRGGGLGTGNDLVVLDEGWALTPDHMSALLPTKSAQPNSQVWSLSSAGHMESEQLRILRDVGRAGADRTLWAEWCGLSAMDPPQLSCADEGCTHRFGQVSGCVLDDRDEWARGNSALGRRIGVEEIEDERRSMTPERFWRERIGRWDEPKAGAVIPLGAWQACARPGSVIDGPVVLWVDVTLDRRRAGVGVCGMSGSAPQVPQVEMAYDGPGADLVVAEVERMLSEHRVVAVGATGSGPVSTLLPEIKRVCESAGVDFVKAGTGEFAGMCGGLYDAVGSQALCHLSDSRVGRSLAAARRRKVVDAWDWERTGVEVDAMPVRCVTGAHGLFGRYRNVSDDYDVMDSIL